MKPYERGGYKADLSGIKKMAILECLYIESWSKKNEGDDNPEFSKAHFKRPKKSSHAPSVKMKFFKRLSVKIKNELYDDKRKSKKNKIALSTYTDYLGEVRRAIQLETNLKSPTLFQDMKDLKEKYPKYSKSFNAISRAKAVDLEIIKNRELSVIQPDDSVDGDGAYKELNSIDVHHPLVNLLSPTVVQTKRVKENTRKNRSIRKNNASEINYRQIVGVVETCLASDDFYELAVGVALATGRRAIEVIHQGDFKKSRRKNDLSFAGVAKKSAINNANKRYVIPMLFSASDVIKAVDKLRSTERYINLKDDISSLPRIDANMVINRRVSRNLNSKIKSLFRNDSIMFKDTRTIAGNIAVEKIYKKQKRYSKLDVGAFRTMYFIHDTFEEAVNYEHIRIDFRAPYTPQAEENDAVDDGLINNPDLSELEAITSVLKSLDMKGMKTILRLHNKVIDTLKDKGGFALSVSSIYKGKKSGDSVVKIGGSHALIKRYMALEAVAYAVDKYHEANDLSTRS